jgi:hypothetical protein
MLLTVLQLPESLTIEVGGPDEGDVDAKISVVR